MRKCSAMFLIMGLLMVLYASGAYAAPTVQYMGFDPALYRYTYRVSLFTGDTLNQFGINGYTLSTTTYTMEDVVNIQGTGGPASKRRTTWASGITYQWYNGSASAGWIGEFSLRIPNSYPLMGQVTALPISGPPAVFSVPVPKVSASPEPSSLIVLGGALLIAGPFLRRQRRKA